jgi:PIN domain nuclease of toxin-antitoxin system
MRLLLDTHALLWWLDGDPSLSMAAQQAIADPDNEVWVSAASGWEITTKHRLGKLPGAGTVAADVAGCLSAQGFVELPISMEHGARAGSLPGPHRDPFDRVLIAQAMLEALVLVSNETAFDVYGAQRLW